jgi:hypothetical protein
MLLFSRLRCINRVGRLADGFSERPLPELQLGICQLVNPSALAKPDVDALGYIDTKRSRSTLKACLDPLTWPSHWPPSQRPPGRGEQRRSDRRRLTAILSLERLNAIEAVPALRELAEDVEEAGDLRDAASSVAGNITWNTSAVRNIYSYQ